MAPPPRILAVYSSSYDDTDSAVVYHGSWMISTKIPGLGVYNHTVTETKEVGDTAVFNFEGSSVRVTVQLHPNLLESSTYAIDGEVILNYTYTGNSLIGAHVIFDSHPLPDGHHALVVTNYGDALSLDKFVVTTTTPGDPDFRRPSGTTPSPSHSSDPSGSGGKQVSSSVDSSSSDTPPELTTSVSLSSTGLTPPSAPTITSSPTGMPLSAPYSLSSTRIPLASRSDSAPASGPSGSSSAAVAAVPSSLQTGAISSTSISISKGAVAGATVGAILCGMAFAASAIFCLVRWGRKRRSRMRSAVTSSCTVPSSSNSSLSRRTHSLLLLLLLLLGTGRPCPNSERVEVESRELPSSKPTARAIFASRRARRHSATVTVSNAVGSSVSVALPAYAYGYIFHEPQVLYGSDLDGPSVDLH